MKQNRSSFWRTWIVLEFIIGWLRTEKDPRDNLLLTQETILYFPKQLWSICIKSQRIRINAVYNYVVFIADGIYLFKRFDFSSMRTAVGVMDLETEKISGPPLQKQLHWNEAKQEKRNEITEIKNTVNLQCRMTTDHAQIHPYPPSMSSSLTSCGLRRRRFLTLVHHARLEWHRIWFGH